MPKRPRENAETVMFGSKEACDLEITDNQNHKFYLQSFMLQLRSAVFRNIERDNQKRECIALDYSTNACQCFLDLVYCDDVTGFSIPHDCLMEVWKLSFQYELSESILKKCQQTIIGVLPSMDTKTLILWANTSSQLHSDSIMGCLFDIFKRPNVLSLQQINELSWEFKDAYLSHILQVSKPITDTPIINNCAEIDEPDFTFFGTPSNCDVVFLSKSGCKFHIHRLLLEMKSDIFRNQPKQPIVQLEYSTNACKLFFWILYATVFPGIPSSRMSELLAMFYEFQMLQYINLLIPQLEKCITDIGVNDCIQIANMAMEATQDNLLLVLYTNIMTPGIWTSDSFKKLDRGFKHAYLLHSWSLVELIEAKDTENNWYVAYVLERTKTRVRVHYCGWSDRWDEWIELARTSPIGTRQPNLIEERQITRKGAMIKETRTLLKPLAASEDSDSSDSD